jgi:hypothetical protein
MDRLLTLSGVDFYARLLKIVSPDSRIAARYENENQSTVWHEVLRYSDEERFFRLIGYGRHVQLLAHDTQNQRPLMIALMFGRFRAFCYMISRLAMFSLLTWQVGTGLTAGGIARQRCTAAVTLREKLQYAISYRVLESKSRNLGHVGTNRCVLL